MILSPGHSQYHIVKSDSNVMYVYVYYVTLVYLRSYVLIQSQLLLVPTK
jgi:hypothetical protein